MSTKSTAAKSATAEDTTAKSATAEDKAAATEQGADKEANTKALQAKLQALEEENAAIKEVVSEQAEKLAAHEKLSDHVTTKVSGTLYAVMNDLRIGGKKVTRKEIAADQELCKKLVATGSHTLVAI